VARFLSSEWFEEVEIASAESHRGGTHALIIKQVVTGGPGGDVSYLVLVDNGHAQVTRTDKPDLRPNLTITTAWETAVAIARGSLSAERALMDGRLRVAGDLSRLAAHGGVLAGLDPIPAEVRASTTF
jgi:putative sterol carrier protein